MTMGRENSRQGEIHRDLGVEHLETGQFSGRAGELLELGAVDAGHVGVEGQGGRES